MGKKTRRPSPALFIAMLALFVALAPVAEAVTSAASQVVRRARVADNARKLQGQNRAQVIAAAAARPGPASSAAALFTTKTQNDSIAPDAEREFPITCDTGLRVVSGGWVTTGSVIAFDSRPTSDTTWTVFLANLSSTQGANVTLYAICVR
jgi:hypothetical protein